MSETRSGLSAGVARAVAAPEEDYGLPVGRSVLRPHRLARWQLCIVTLLCCCVGANAQTGATPAAPSTFGGLSQMSQIVSGQTVGGGVLSQSPFAGGTPVGTPTAGTIDLSLSDALDRGLKYNLGLLLSTQAGEQVRASRLRSMSDLLPNVNARLGETREKINLAALGVPAALLKGASPIVGPFSVFDTRATVTETLSLKLLRSLRAATENVRASQLSVRDARELVVLFVGAGYVQALASESRIAAIQAQLATSQTLYQQAVDMKNAGTVAGIDVLRAQVEMEVQQQRLVAARNEFEKSKLQLARAIGLPQGQQFRLSTAAPYKPIPPLSLNEALDRAFRERPDYQSAFAAVQAAELSRRAAIAERLPSLQFGGDYGLVGNQPGSSHATFTAIGSLVVPVFEGGRIRSDIQNADAVLKQRQFQLEDTRARVEFDVRSAFLDLNSAAEQVEVARSSVGLATEQLKQAQDRFAAGVATNIEVIQAQESLALANENYIGSLLAHNLAKLSLARALGIAETSVRQFLGGSR